MRLPIRDAIIHLAALLTALVLSTDITSAKSVTVTFIQTNDIDRIEADSGRGGFARLATVIAGERAKGHAVFIHAGDTLSPSLLSGLDGGKNIVDILNRLKPDVLTPGNHEFDFGPDNFRARIAEMQFDVVTSNVREADGSQPRNTIDEKIIDIDGIRIGFYGLTTETTRTASTPGNMQFLPALETARAKAAALRKKSDIVVAVVHTSLATDMLLARDHAADIVASGHDEHLLTFYDGKTVVTEAGSQADYVVLTTLTIDKQEKDGATSVVWRPDFRIIDTRDVVPDPAIDEVVKDYTSQLDRELGKVIGTSATALDSRRATIRTQEAAIGNLFADAMREAVQADVAVINGGGIRADRVYENGSALTRKTILAELPFGNKTAKLQLTGTALKSAMENGLSGVRELPGVFRRYREWK